MRAHAVLSASAAHRWIACPPSARLEAQMPNETSQYAEEGVLAHKIAELKLKKQYFNLDAETYAAELKKLQEHELYNNEMLSYTDEYVDYINEITYSSQVQPYIVIEKRLNLTDYVPDGFGTSDCLILADDTLHVIDFKYGKGVPVSAENNPQMRLYALGAFKAYQLTYNITRVITHIVQPRLGAASIEEITVEDLLAWGETVKNIAKIAFAGLGEFSPGEHCKFCRAKAVCRARAKKYTALQDFGFKKPETLTNEEIGEILQLAENLVNWVSDLKEYALAEMLKGNEVPGWKAVEGRSVRTIRDIDEAFKKLIEAGYDEALLYDRKPKTITELEKLLTKKRFNELLSDYIVKPPGKPTLVPMDDKREAIKKISAKEDFKVIS